MKDGGGLAWGKARLRNDRAEERKDRNQVLDQRQDESNCGD
jgi:hypothetical protein